MTSLFLFLFLISLFFFKKNRDNNQREQALAELKPKTQDFETVYERDGRIFMLQIFIQWFWEVSKKMDKFDVPVRGHEDFDIYFRGTSLYIKDKREAVVDKREEWFKVLNKVKVEDIGGYDSYPETFLRSLIDSSQEIHASDYSFRDVITYCHIKKLIELFLREGKSKDVVLYEISCHPLMVLKPFMPACYQDFLTGLQCIPEIKPNRRYFYIAQVDHFSVILYISINDILKFGLDHRCFKGFEEYDKVRDHLEETGYEKTVEQNSFKDYSMEKAFFSEEKK